jgi:hypothetical protein
LKLKFYDLDAIIRSDSIAFVDLFSQMYRRFRVDRSPSQARPGVEFTALTRTDNPWGQPVLILDDQVLTLNDAGFFEGFIYESILNAILARVRSHFLIHAGVVALDGRGILLVADSRHGKTTLVLALVRRGFRFLSDEIAALGRDDKKVHSFPRSLRIRPGTLELAGFPEAAVGAPTWLDKLLLDIEEIEKGCLVDVAAIHRIVVLQDPARGSEEGQTGSVRELGVLVDRLDDAFIASVNQIDGVAGVQTSSHGGYPLLKIRAKRRTFALSQIEALCAGRGILVLDIVKRAEGRPEFTASAQLESISNSQAVMELLRRFQGGHKSALLQEECGGDSTRLFLELAGLIDQVDCHQLTVGPLNEMVDLVCELVT